MGEVLFWFLIGMLLSLLRGRVVCGAKHKVSEPDAKPVTSSVTLYKLQVSLCLSRFICKMGLIMGPKLEAVVKV